MNVINVNLTKEKNREIFNFEYDGIPLSAHYNYGKNSNLEIRKNDTIIGNIQKPKIPETFSIEGPNGEISLKAWFALLSTVD